MGFRPPVHLPGALPAAAELPSGASSPTAIDAIYGLYELVSGWHLAVVTQSATAASGPYQVPIYQVHDMAWYPLQRRSSAPPLSAEQRAEEE